MAQPRGIRYPFTFGAAGGVRGAQGVEKVKSNLEHLVKSKLKERLVRKDVGTVSYDLVLRNSDPSSRSLVETLIREAIVRFEPRAILKNISVFQQETEDGNHVFLDVEFLFRETGEVGTLSTQLTSPS